MASGTVVDELVVQLGIDPSKFTAQQRAVLREFKNTQEEALRGAKNVEAAGKRVGDFFSSMKREIIGGFAAFFGGKGAAEFASYLTNTNAQLGRSANLLEMSSKELAVWQGMARATGGTAEGMSASMKSMNQAVNTFLLTGQGPFLPVMNALGIGLYKANGQLKTMGELFLELHNAVQGMGAGRAAAFLANFGLDENTINLLISGNAEFSKLKKSIESLIPATKEDTDAAKELSAAWAEATVSADNFGTKVMTKLTPALVGFLGRWRDILTEMSKGVIVSPGSLVDRVWKWALGHPAAGFAPATSAPSTTPAASGAASGTMSETEVRAYIRAAAIKRGMDPDVAVKVWESEGKQGVGPSKQSTVVRPDGTREESYGPFQLYTRGGLGNVFQNQTGLDPRDPSTFRQQIDFSLDQAKQNGWGPWHGWKGARWAGINDGGAGAAESARGGSAHTTSIKIDTVQVNTAATDAEGIASGIKGALERDNLAQQANYGQN